MSLINPKDNLNFELNCELCNKSFTEETNNPILLKCGHTICNHCFENPVDEYYVNNDSSDSSKSNSNEESEDSDNSKNST